MGLSKRSYSSPLNVGCKLFGDIKVNLQVCYSPSFVKTALHPARVPGTFLLLGRSHSDLDEDRKRPLMTQESPFSCR